MGHHLHRSRPERWGGYRSCGNYRLLGRRDQINKREQGARVRATLREIRQPGMGKRETRRVLENVPPPPEPKCHPKSTALHDAPYLDAYCGERQTEANPRGMSNNWLWWQIDNRLGSPEFKVKYRPGDRLYVREHWRTADDLDAKSPSQIMANCRAAGWENPWCPIEYDADAERDYWSSDDWPQTNKVGKFRQAMHMPKPMSRITLTVTDVAVERIQDISFEDVIAEGVACKTCLEMGQSACANKGCFAAIIDFKELWDSLNADRGHGWDANPWVAVYRFSSQLGNIDRMAA